MIHVSVSRLRMISSDYFGPFALGHRLAIPMRTGSTHRRENAGESQSERPIRRGMTAYTPTLAPEAR